MTEPDEPGKLAETGDRDANGRFLPGHIGMGGRPRGYDFHTLLVKQLQERNETVDVVFGELVSGLRAAVKVPSCAPAASKVLFDRICGPVSPIPVHGSEFEPTDEAFA